MAPSTQIGMDLGQTLSFSSQLPSQASSSTDRERKDRETAELLAQATELEQQIGQMVFKGPILPLENLTCISDAVLITPERLTAMQRLIKRIAQLQAQQEATDDPLSDPTRSPEALLPQVLLEVQAVLRQASVTDPGLPAVPSPALVGNQPIYAIYPLSSRLLWHIAQSTHEVMRLLEGMAAEVSRVEASPSGARDGRQDSRQVGIVRLVAQIEVQTAQFHHALDLVTFQTPAPALPETAQIRISAILLGQQSVSVATLLQRLTAQFRTKPLLHQFMTGLQTEILMPQQSWQSGQVGLGFRLVFTPTASVESSPTASSGSVEGVGLAQSSFSEPLPVVQFTQPSWLEQHITTVVEDQLAQVLGPSISPSISPSQGAIASTGDPLTDPALSIVQQAIDAIDALQRSLTMASRTLAPQSLPLEELALRLQWNLTRTAYGVMQLLSGVSVHLLQPQQNWRAGSLRWGVYLVVQAPQQSWQFDLVRRALVGANEALPGWENLPGTEAAIVQFSDPSSGFWVEPLQSISLSDLETKLWYPISQVAPELLLLRSETEVKVTTHSAAPTVQPNSPSTVQMGVVQLKTRFEFCAD